MRERGYRLTRRPETKLRGYGGDHQAKRRAAARLVASGAARCARGADCFYAELVDGKLVGGLIKPGEPFDLGHDDVDRSKYSGPEHRRCNRATAGRRRRSRKW